MLARIPATLLLLALALPIHAAVPAFTQNIACPPLRVRLPKDAQATPTPATEAYRGVMQHPDGSVVEVDAFVPEQLWRKEQRLGAWADAAGNKYELVAPKSLLGGPFPQAIVTREVYDAIQAKAPALALPTMGKWLTAWVGAPCGRPTRLKPLGAVANAIFAEVGNAAALVLWLKAEPDQPYALIVTPGPNADPAAKWRTALSRAMPGFAPIRGGLSGSAKEAGGWLTLDRPPYRLHTDLPRRDRAWLDTLLADMAAIREAYTRALPEPSGVKIPTSVIRVFADPEDYRAYSGEGMEWSAGHFSSVQRELVVMGDAAEDSNKRRRDEIRSTTFHEGFHQYLFLITPALANVPIWFNEGHATFFETFRVRNGKASPGESPRIEAARRAIGLRSPEGLGRFMMLSQPEFYATSIQENYAVAWLLVHWLRTEAKAPLDTALNRYYAILCAGKKPAEAQAEVFPPETLRAISEGLADYLSKH